MTSKAQKVINFGFEMLKPSLDGKVKTTVDTERHYGMAKGILYACLSLGGIDSSEYDKLLSKAVLLHMACEEAQKEEMSETIARCRDAEQRVD